SREKAAPAEVARRARWTGLLRFPAVLDRYVLARFLSALVFVLLSVVVLAFIVDYADHVDEILRNKPPWSIVAGYYRYFLYNISMLLAPFGVLVAALLGLGALSRHNEDTAFKASGVSLYRLGAPVLVAACVGGLGAFALGEYVGPIANQREARFRNVIYGRPMDYGTRFASERNWFCGEDGRIWFREETDPQRGLLVAPTVFTFGPGFQLARRDQAREAKWSGKDWVFRTGWSRTFDGPAETGYARFGELAGPGDLPAAFTRERRTAEEMTLGELEAYTSRLKRSGYPTASLETALHQKISRAVLIPLMALLAIPFA